MATKDSPMELHQITIASEGSNPSSEWDDDSEQDPDFDILEQTHRSFYNLSLTNKAKKSIGDDKGFGTVINPEVLEMNAPSFDDDGFETVHKKIKAGLLEKLKVDECKIYLKKNGLRLTGNKDTLIQRIKEHQEIVNGGGEKKYPPHSFVLNCKGDACTGDVVLFEQNVYEMFNIASRSASGPPCGQRIVAGRIVKESYGAAKQQHTFTIEVLWSKGEKPLPPLHPLLIKGRNLYRLKTLRQKWEDEDKRQKMIMEKHSRGSVARADREARIHEKEMRKAMKENRISKKGSTKNQCQSHSSIARSQNENQETTNVFINPGKSEIPPRHSVLSTLIVNKPEALNKCVPFVDSQTVATGPDRIGNPGKSYASANYYGADYHYRDKPITVDTYNNFIAETNKRAERCFLRKPLESVNHFFPCSSNVNPMHRMNSNRESYKQKQLCRHFARGRCHFGDNCKFLHDL